MNSIFSCLRARAFCRRTMRSTRTVLSTSGKLSTTGAEGPDWLSGERSSTTWRTFKEPGGDGGEVTEDLEKGSLLGLRSCVGPSETMDTVMAARSSCRPCTSCCLSASSRFSSRDCGSSRDGNSGPDLVIQKPVGLLQLGLELCEAAAELVQLELQRVALGLELGVLAAQLLGEAQQLGLALSAAFDVTLEVSQLAGQAVHFLAKRPFCRLMISLYLFSSSSQRGRSSSRHFNCTTTPPGLTSPSSDITCLSFGLPQFRIQLVGLDLLRFLEEREGHKNKTTMMRANERLHSYRGADMKSLEEREGSSASFSPRTYFITMASFSWRASSHFLPT
ncbi:hypothetical protein EYF80_022010 [Liparis tanakae]|uniref:Uncharacterized protein n=1 Tax=Liparis tanakae TaxID=230148 RepID=A0A4Z2HRR0_9TELE|nr:hypothetical protein EYF80_022010 [Liparis tanakae]